MENVKAEEEMLPSVHERVSVEERFADVMTRHATRELQRRKLVVQQLWVHLALQYQRRSVFLHLWGLANLP